jgi:outer membrane lipoprotein-sorting protein
MKTFFLVVVCVFFAIGSAFSQTQLGNTTYAPKVEDILRRMADQYSEAESYQDKGFVQVTVAKPSTSRPKILNTFRSYFARPGFYRFEWNSDAEPKSGWNVIWTTGDFFSTLDINGKPELEISRGTTIAKATAVTRGASQTVATLLTGTVRGFRVSNILDAELIRDENFEAENCYVIRGRHPLGFEIDLWVSKNDYLIRKIRQINGDGSFQEEIRRDIKLDEPIAPEVFQYKSKKTAPKNIT